ncbi:MAG: tetratricopeptide repeat protein, partial [Pseudomonadota bacterium]
MKSALRLTVPGLMAPALALAMGLSLGLSGTLGTSGVAMAAESEPVITTPKCKRGFAWDRKVRKCVKAKKSSSLDDEDLFNTARELAYERRYDEALAMINLAENQNTPRMLNYRGFVTRKLGRVDEALGYYKAALAIDP